MNFQKLKGDKRVIYFFGAILFIIILLVLFQVQSNISQKKLAATLAAETEASRIATEKVVKQTPVPISTSIPVVAKPNIIDYQQYNYQFAETPVVNILKSMIGNGRFAIYLPPTEYINITKGSDYGVAYAIKNPILSGENEFTYSWTADDSVINNCKISKTVADSYIKMGSSTSGKITWNEWVDAATVYFKFPSSMESCNLKYNFKATKDDVDYVNKQIEFNIL